MNDADLNKLPRYITAPDSEMWGPMPDGFSISNVDAIFVKLSDVQGLLKPSDQGVPGFICVGPGGPALKKRAFEFGWDLHCCYADGTLTDGWSGDSPSKKYYIKKDIDA